MIATSAGGKNGKAKSGDGKLSVLLFVVRAAAVGAAATGAVMALGFPQLFDYMLQKVRRRNKVLDCLES